MIDLSLMRNVEIDQSSCTAWVEGGATLGDFDSKAQEFGLATPLGTNSTTGVAGLTLGGGFGWLSRRWGLTVDNLLAVDLITARAGRMQVNATNEPDLFWALRGGGGNFGVVTRFQFRLHALGNVLAGLLIYPLAQALPALRKYRELIAELPTRRNASPTPTGRTTSAWPKSSSASIRGISSAPIKTSGPWAERLFPQGLCRT